MSGAFESGTNRDPARPVADGAGRTTPVPAPAGGAAPRGAGPAPPLLEIENLTTVFDSDEGVVRAVDGVSFTVAAGEVFGLVGESGCGKTVTNLSILRLVPDPPGRIESGAVRLGGLDLRRLTPGEMRRVRGKRVAMIFQDPMTSLNPLLSIERQMTEVLELHEGLSRREGRARSVEMLGRVGIPDAARRVHDYPHHFSGGMRQRVMIAMALLCRPEVLLADEPTTALDVTIQAQILLLLKDLGRELGTALVLVTHDMGIVAGMAHRVAVMYAGRIVEQAPVAELFARPRHPYTIGLLRSLPGRAVPDVTTGPAAPRRRLPSIPGRPPDLARLPAGCPFEPRCPWAFERCRAERPPLRGSDAGYPAACWMDDPMAAPPARPGMWEGEA